jgi:ataxin-3
MLDDIDYWIYHERQEAMLCGQHALNNLVQECTFSAGSLAQIAVSA